MTEKEKIEEAKILYQTATNADVKSMLEILFPELKESEDEKIRKALVQAVWGTLKGRKLFGTNITREDALAWLEKQGVKEQDVRYENLEELLAADDIYQMAMNHKMVQEAKEKAVNALSEMCIGRLLGLEKQGEKRPVDKVEPKFKVGDWITDGYVGGQITNIEYNYPCYKIADFMGGINTSIPFTLQDNYRLWTIQDAKDGDVLYSLDSNRPFIYKVRNDYEQAVAYCGLNIYGKFFVWNTKDCVITLSNYVPATKEQRNLLFQKMHEAGWEWDVDKKELKKIEKQAPQEQDEFEAELNALLKKYEHLPKHELADSILSSTFELKKI